MPCQKFASFLDDMPFRDNAGHPHIKQIKLWRLKDNTAILTSLERFDKPPEQGINQDLIILTHSFGVDTAVTRDIGIIDDLSHGISHGVKEAGKCRDVTRQSFVENLLF